MRGFTLLELMVVLVIIGLAATGITMGMRSSDEMALYQEAERVSAALETGRVQSRARGVAAEFVTSEKGFIVKSPNAGIDESKVQPWLKPGTSASRHACHLRSNDHLAWAGLVAVGWLVRGWVLGGGCGG